MGLFYTKWELHESNITCIRESFNAIWGVVSRGKVLCDLYVKFSKRTGLPKYKYVHK